MNTNKMKRLLYILILLMPMVAKAQNSESYERRLERLEQKIARLDSYCNLFYVWCDSTVLCPLDSLNMLASEKELNRLLTKGTGMQRTAAFLLICSRTNDLAKRQHALQTVVNDTSIYYDGCWDMLFPMKVGGFCFSWARDHGWATDEQYAKQIETFDKYDTWGPFEDGPIFSYDSLGHFTRVRYPEPSMPEFPGGQAALFRYLEENVVYPKILSESSFQGRTICQFTIEEDGSITNAEVVRSCGEKECDDEALRLINAMPKWKPATTCGKSIRLRGFIVPVKFTLR